MYLINDNGCEENLWANGGAEETRYDCIIKATIDSVQYSYFVEESLDDSLDNHATNCQLHCSASYDWSSLSSTVVVLGFFGVVRITVKPDCNPIGHVPSNV